MAVNSLQRDDISLTNGVWTGPTRQPVNASLNEKGSIHDPERAKELGLRGGTVAGSIHMEQFPPVLNAVFGRDWLRQGGLSLYFVNATLDAEPVQCFAKLDPESKNPARAEAWMEAPDGTLICKGSACFGGMDEQSELRQRLETIRPADELRILKALSPGDACEKIPSRLSAEESDKRISVVTETHEAFSDDEIYGEKIATVSAAVNVLRAVESELFKVQQPVVGLFGAIELQFLNGPIFVEHDYLARGKVLALSTSPKTEIVWYEAILSELEGQDIASLIMMTRFMKGSSPLWTE
jgi:hypothetical protein